MFELPNAKRYVSYLPLSPPARHKQYKQFPFLPFTCPSHRTTPNARLTGWVNRVRRLDLLDDGRSSGGEEDVVDDVLHAELQTKLRDQLATTLEWAALEYEPLRKDEAPPSSAEAVADGGGECVNEVDGHQPPEEFEFRLFSTEKQGSKIVLEEEKPSGTGVGGIVAKRPASYYYARPATAEERKQYESCVVKYDDIIKGSQERWWGLEYPWKIVAKLTLTSKKARQLSRGNKTHISAGDKKKKRTRPGKKVRILRRKRDREIKGKDESEKQAQVSKEEHLKAKKRRLNHVKKLRARAKAKVKKLDARQVGADDAGENVGVQREAGTT